METKKSVKTGPGGDRVEWLLGALSAVAVAAMIGFLLYQALAARDLAATLDVTAGRIEQRGDAYYVNFQALNRGGTTAAGATVEGTLMDGGRALETSEVTLDYLPARSERSGALMFRNDPRTYRLQLDVKGYRAP
jgi:uncharacterized protein (TIGR02588 family)